MRRVHYLLIVGILCYNTFVNAACPATETDDYLPWENGAPVGAQASLTHEDITLETVRLLSKARTHPDEYIAELETMRDKFATFNGAGACMPEFGNSIGFSTSKWNSVISAVRDNANRNPLHFSDQITRGVMDMVVYQCEAGARGETVEDGSSVHDRIKEYAASYNQRSWVGMTAPISARMFAARIISTFGASILGSTFSYIGLYCGCSTNQDTYCYVYLVDELQQTDQNYTEAQRDQGGMIPQFNPTNKEDSCVCDGRTSHDEVVKDREWWAPDAGDPCAPYYGKPFGDPDDGIETWKTMSLRAFYAQNVARTKNPDFSGETFQDYIQRDICNFNNDKSAVAKFNTMFGINEGFAVWEEALDYVINHDAIDPLSWADSLAESCKHHAEQMGWCGKTGHTGLDGSNMGQRVQLTTQGYSTAGENLAYNSWSGIQNILSLVIDDGVPSRGHRHNIYNTAFTHAGVFCTCMNEDYETGARFYTAYCCFNYGAGLTVYNFTSGADMETVRDNRLAWTSGTRDSAECQNQVNKCPFAENNNPCVEQGEDLDDDGICCDEDDCPDYDSDGYGEPHNLCQGLNLGNNCVEDQCEADPNAPGYCKAADDCAADLDNDNICDAQDDCVDVDGDTICEKDCDDVCIDRNPQDGRCNVNSCCNYDRDNDNICDDVRLNNQASSLPVDSCIRTNNNQPCDCDPLYEAYMRGQGFSNYDSNLDSDNLCDYADPCIDTDGDDRCEQEVNGEIADKCIPRNADDGQCGQGSQCQYDYDDDNQCDPPPCEDVDKDNFCDLENDICISSAPLSDKNPDATCTTSTIGCRRDINGNNQCDDFDSQNPDPCPRFNSQDDCICDPTAVDFALDIDGDGKCDYADSCVDKDQDGLCCNNGVDTSLDVFDVCEDVNSDGSCDLTENVSGQNYSYCHQECTTDLDKDNLCDDESAGNDQDPCVDTDKDGKCEGTNQHPVDNCISPSREQCNVCDQESCVADIDCDNLCDDTDPCPMLNNECQCENRGGNVDEDQKCDDVDDLIDLDLDLKNDAHVMTSCDDAEWDQCIRDRNSGFDRTCLDNPYNADYQCVSDKDNDGICDEWKSGSGGNCPADDCVDIDKDGHCHPADICENINIDNSVPPNGDCNPHWGSCLNDLDKDNICNDNGGDDCNNLIQDNCDSCPDVDADDVCDPVDDCIDVDKDGFCDPDDICSEIYEDGMNGNKIRTGKCSNKCDLQDDGTCALTCLSTNSDGVCTQHFQRDYFKTWCNSDEDGDNKCDQWASVSPDDCVATPCGCSCHEQMGDLDSDSICDFRDTCVDQDQDDICEKSYLFPVETEDKKFDICIQMYYGGSHENTEDSSGNTVYGRCFVCNPGAQMEYCDCEFDADGDNICDLNDQCIDRDGDELCENYPEWTDICVDINKDGMCWKWDDCLSDRNHDNVCDCYKDDDGDGLCDADQCQSNDQHFPEKRHYQSQPEYLVYKCRCEDDENEDTPIPSGNWGYENYCKTNGCYDDNNNRICDWDECVEGNTLAWCAGEYDPTPDVTEPIIYTFQYNDTITVEVNTGQNGMLLQISALFIALSIAIFF